MTQILLVEDDNDIRETIGEVLEEEGYRVITAANGIEALERLKDTSHVPDLILLDLMMPGMDGWRFRSEQLKLERGANIPLLVLSADGQTQDVATGLGAVGCLRKPVDLDQLLATLAELTR